MKTLLTTAAVALALTSAAVAAPKIPADFQGEWCLTGPSFKDRNDYFPADAEDGCKQSPDPRAMLIVTDRRVNDNYGNFCTVIGIKPFDIFDPKRGKNPWGQPGYRVTLTCVPNNDGDKPWTLVQEWAEAKGYLMVKPVRR